MTDWIVYKFGGTSLATAERIKHAANLVKSCTAPRLAVVVSAMKGVTDSLEQLTRTTLHSLADSDKEIDSLRQRHLDAWKILLPDASFADLSLRLEESLADISQVLRSVALLHECPVSARDYIMGFGEIWNAWAMEARLQTQGLAAAFIDARAILCVEAGTAGSHSHRRPD